MMLVALLMVVGLGLLIIAGISLFKLFHHIYVLDLPATSFRTWKYSILAILFFYPAVMCLTPSLSRFYGLPSKLDKYLDDPEVFKVKEKVYNMDISGKADVEEEPLDYSTFFELGIVTTCGGCLLAHQNAQTKDTAILKDSIQ